jgi:putative FmdB family regulatory protein
MPLYEYQCVKCGKKSEFIRSFSDPHETTCPWCGGALKKLLSSPAFQFKGSGFYATDYGKSGGSKSEDSKSEEKKSSSKGEEGTGGSEAKGAGAGESKGDSSKGEKGSGGEANAAPAAPSGPSSPAPSKKKKGDTK